MSNLTQLEQIKAKIEAMKAEKAKVSVETANLEIIKDVFVAPSENQIKTYVKLCSEKRVQMNPSYRSFDGRKNGAMDKAIKELIKLPRIIQPSEGQINMLKEICERNQWEMPAYSHLVGGRDGSFSKLIGELIGLEKELTKVAPPTEKQIETILNMYFCPDVDFSDLHEQYALKYVNVDVEGKIHGNQLLWTRPNQETIALTVADLITFEMASNFIYKYQLEFHKWTRTRCSASQMEKIRRVQESCKMQPMEDYQLMQFDRATADKYITNLNLVRRDADLVKFPQEPCMDDIDRTDTASKARDKDEEKKSNLLHSLYGAMGMNGNEESETSIDLSANDDIIADLALVVIDCCGFDAVMGMMNEVYDAKEMGDMLRLMYPEKEQEICTEGMSLEELEQLAKEMSA